MADLEFRRDPTNDYVTLCSHDEYPLPGDVWELAYGAPYRGQYSRARKGELRLSRTAAADLIEHFRTEGHRVFVTEGTRFGAPAPVGGCPECATCGRPFPADKVVAPGEMCPNDQDTTWNAAGSARVPTYPPHALVLVPPPTGPAAPTSSGTDAAR